MQTQKACLLLKLGAEPVDFVLQKWQEQVLWYEWAEQVWELGVLLCTKDILGDNTVCALGYYNIPSAQQFLIKVPDTPDTPLLFINY